MKHEFLAYVLGGAVAISVAVPFVAFAYQRGEPLQHPYISSLLLWFVAVGVLSLAMTLFGLWDER